MRPSRIRTQAQMGQNAVKYSSVHAEGRAHRPAHAQASLIHNLSLATHL